VKRWPSSTRDVTGQAMPPPMRHGVTADIPTDEGHYRQYLAQLRTLATNNGGVFLRSGLYVAGSKVGLWDAEFRFEQEVSAHNFCCSGSARPGHL
jgi:hypothetical protein